MSIEKSGPFKTVNSIHEGHVLPDSIQEMGTMVVRIARDTEIRGGILCTDLTVDNLQFRVEGPVCALQSATINICEDSIGEFGGGLIAGKNIAIKHENGDGRVRIIGDVSANFVHLQRTVVYGNVLSGSAQLSDTVVLGAIACTGRLKMKNSICSTFQATSAQLGPGNYIFGFGASVSKSIEIEEPLGSLAMVPLEKNIIGNTSDFSKMVKLTNEDLHRVKAEGEHYILLHPYDRVLNVEGISELGENANFIAGSILERSGERMRGRLDMTASALQSEDYFFNILGKHF